MASTISFTISVLIYIKCITSGTYQVCTKDLSSERLVGEINDLVQT